MRVLTRAAAMVVLLTGPAHAQGTQSQPPPKTPMQLIDDQRQRELADVERQYERRAKTPDSDAKNDPWRTMRSVQPPAQKR
jgi:hypothetical protein